MYKVIKMLTINEDRTKTVILLIEYKYWAYKNKYKLD